MRIYVLKHSISNNTARRSSDSVEQPVSIGRKYIFTGKASTKYCRTLNGDLICSKATDSFPTSPLKQFQFDKVSVTNLATTSNRACLSFNSSRHFSSVALHAQTLRYVRDTKPAHLSNTKTESWSPVSCKYRIVPSHRHG